ncbi:cytochrome P450 [Lactarius sanguifluus]|nr:cytochrome P450 [Lactarius sanguifluus]
MFNPYAHSFHEGLYRTSMVFWGTKPSLRKTGGHPHTFGPAIDSTSDKQAVSCVDFARLGRSPSEATKMLNPVFGVNHMRHPMSPIFHRVARQLRGNLESIVSDGPQEINIADWIDRFALELLGEAGLGYSFGTLEDRNDEYCRALNEWLPPTSSLAVYRDMFPYVCKIFHPKFSNHARRIYETKKRLLELGDGATVGDGRTPSVFSDSDLEISSASQYDGIRGRWAKQRGTACTNSDKLRKELKEACEDNGEVTHDQFVSLPFLEAVCRQTLRLHWNNENIYNLNRDSSIWGIDAAEWKPERWLTPRPESVARANIPGVYANTSVSQTHKMFLLNVLLISSSENVNQLRAGTVDRQ